MTSGNQQLSSSSFKKNSPDNMQDFKARFEARKAEKLLKLQSDSPQSDFHTQSKQKLAAYVENSTRFSITDIEFSQVNEHVEHFEVESIFELDTVAETREEAGIKHGTNSDYETKDWSLYDKQVKLALLSETNRKETLAELHADLIDASYGKLRAKKLFREHPQRFFYYYICGSCQGQGKVACSSCRGSGKTGCGSCSGSGTVQVAVQETTNVSFHNGTSWQTRQDVKTRYENRSCGGCGGGGSITCSGCHGSGKQRCEPCSGTGNFTKTTVIETSVSPHYQAFFHSTSPSYVRDAIENKAGLLGLLNGYAKHIKRDFFINESDRALCLTTHFQIPFVNLNMSAMGVNAKIIVFGYNVTVFDTGHIIEKLVKSDFEKLVNGVVFKYQIKPNFNKHITPILSDFISSEIHQEMLNHSSGSNYIKIQTDKFDTHNRFLSFSAIRKTLKKIEIATTFKGFWKFVKYSFFAYILISAIMFFAQPLFESVWANKVMASNADELSQANETSSLWLLLLYILVAATIYIWKHKKPMLTNTDKVYEALNRSLSIEYIRESLKKIYTANRTQKAWIVAKNSIVAAILIVPLLLLLEFWFVYFGDHKFEITDVYRIYLVSRNTSNFGLVTVSCFVATGLFFVMIRLQHLRWLKKCGGVHFIHYIRSKKLLPALGVALWLPVPVLFVSYIFIVQQGIWVDLKGNLYGAIPYVSANKITISLSHPDMNKNL